MGNGMTYLGVLGLLVRLTAALGGNASERALEGAGLRLAELVNDAEGTARQQAAFTASKQVASRKLRDPLVEGQHLASGMNPRTAKSPETPIALMPAAILW